MKKIQMFYFLLMIPFFALCANSPQVVHFMTADSGVVYANLLGQGDHGVVLAHGAIFNKESWNPLAKKLAAAGFTVLAIDFRGYGKSRAGKHPRALYEDVLAAVRYLKQRGVKKVSVIGASMGGGAAATAAVNARPNEIYKLILLSPVPIRHPENIHAADILYIGSAEERLMPRIRAQYQRAPEPRVLEVIPGNAHAQHIFKTNQGNRLTQIILRFLNAEVGK